MAQAHHDLTGPEDTSVDEPLRAEVARPVAPPDLRRRMQLYFILGPLVVLVTLWIWLFYAEGAFKDGPNGVSFGADYAMFITAAQILQSGGNPYDHQRLYQVERADLARDHIPILRKSAVVRVGNPPLLYVAMRPLTWFPFRTSAWIWMAALYVLCGLGIVALLKSMGWRRLFLPSLIFLLMPQTVFGPFYGNVTAVVFAGLCLALAVARRYPYVAGVFLTVAWLKPPTALPVALLIVLFHVEHRHKVVKGFACATLTLLSAMLLTCGPLSVPHWLHGLMDYSADMALSPDVASFAGMYVRTLPHSFRLLAEGCSLLVALLITALAWYRYRASASAPPLAVAWLWVLWFLATPYAHFYDEVLLAFPLLLLVGVDGRWLTRPRSAIAIYLALFSLVVISATPFNIQLLWLPLIAIMLCMFEAARDPRYAVA